MRISMLRLAPQCFAFTSYDLLTYSPYGCMQQKGRVRKPVQAEQEAGRHAQLRQHYAELDFADRCPVPPPPSDMFVVAYAEVGQA